MFDKEFYPTPLHVLDTMLFDVDLKNKTVLEPQAGSGNIIDYCYSHGAKKVLCCERNLDLAQISSSKGQFLGYDSFELKPEQISHVDFIIMNPPFSNAAEHILHLYEIAPDGCEIISLVNYETIDNTYSNNRTRLKELIKKIGTSTNLGNVFSDAERETNVNIGLIHLYKPRKANEFEFSDYWSLSEEYENTDFGIVKHDEINELINRFVGAVKLYDEQAEISKRANELIKPISNEKIKFGCLLDTYEYKNERMISRDEFKSYFQKQCWQAIFNKLDMDRFITTEVKKNINSFVENQTKVPFTRKNIFKMLEVIVGTHKNRMENILVDMFDKVCELSAKNSTAGEKWKTNSNYKVNQKIIMPFGASFDKWFPERVKLSEHRVDFLKDLNKALCYLMAKEYTNEYWISSYNTRFIFGEWVEWGFFRVKAFKKGTLHLEFLDPKVCQMFNKTVSKIKGWVLPSETDTKQTGREKSKSKKMNIYV